MRKISLRSHVAVNACNFFLACTVTIVAPFLAEFLEENDYKAKAVGIATAMPGLGVLVSMIPVGAWIDRTSHRRRVLSLASLCVGVMFGCIPWMIHRPWVIDGIMFMSGVLESCFTPLLFALALALAGRDGINRMVGTNQAWNHAGSIFAALASAALLRVCSRDVVFYTLTVYACLAAGACMAIKRTELNEPPRRMKRRVSPGSIRDILRDRRVLVLLVSVAFFHFVNQPILPLLVIQPGVGKRTSSLIFVAQATMVIVAYVAGRAGERFGRKPILGFALAVLPIRVALDALATQTWQIEAIQVLDGMGAGIYNVIIAAICSDLAERNGRFNTMVGITTTALAVGAMLGPLCGGYFVDLIGFRATLLSLAAVAVANFVFYIAFMKETIDGQPA